MNWSEAKIGRILARDTFKDMLCVLPNTYYAGEEADLLCVSKSLRLIDVEIKISRADLKRDPAKDKWWQSAKLAESVIVESSWGPRPGKPQIMKRYPKIPRAYPRHVWKHYYAMPESIWKPELLEFVQPISGVLLISDDKRVKSIKRCKPNLKAPLMDAHDLMLIARLCSYRMWDAYGHLEKRADGKNHMEAPSLEMKSLIESAVSSLSS